MTFLCTILLWLAIAGVLWCVAGPVCRRLNLTAAADRAIVGMLLGFFGLLAGLFVMASFA